MMPFFSYYGGKWRAAPHYPSPMYPTIVEPFAGSAGYAVRHPHHKVRLYDTNPIIVGVWDYLIHAPSSEIQSLPLVFDNVDDLTLPQECRWLIGFWLNKGAASPCKTPSAWMRSGIRPKSFWGDEIRSRIASQVSEIRHWMVEEKSYSDVPNRVATWFIDPPYIDAGKHYTHSLIDYDHLGAWCREVFGQRIVCENEGAKWLPFVPFRSIKATGGDGRTGKSAEVIFAHDDCLPGWLA